MDGNCADIVRMCLKRCDLLRGVVVVDAHLEVIGTYRWAASAQRWSCTSEVERTSNNPVLPRNEATSTNGDISKLECLDDRLRDV